MLGFTSVSGLLLVYALNTWLPELMSRAGFSAKGSLAFLLVLNGGAVLGALFGSRVADRFGPKPVVASCFLIGAVSIGMLTVRPSDRRLLSFVAVVGLGTSGTQILSSASSRTTSGRTSAARRWPGAPASAAWVASAARSSAASSIAAGFALNSIFYILAGVALLGMILTLLVPSRRTQDVTATTIEPSVTAGDGVAQAGRADPTA